MSATIAALSVAPVALGWAVHSIVWRRRIAAARRDPLTGLPTRAPFEAQAPRLLAAGTAVLVIDLDSFKALNDRHGHAAGDAALITVAHVLAATAAVMDDCAARLGGDEFVLALPIQHPDDLPFELASLHAWLCEPFTFEGKSVSVGASIGAVMVGQGPVPPLDRLMRRADEAMYAAKQTGAGWFIATDTTPALPTTNGRRAGRRGTAGGSEAAA
ncbi:GGDEF domain-containing protein [Streptomyces albospinus]|uniref:GGDEF domain-containing protein n=1 Tax=Streptomyces albospinus TaxID=285515 RepID=A0ABQ2V0R5_9ACTN|nr:GGDEF domain-containing protein [Streptomyces albospinus]GGU63550.1 GGDEF domain-containing protein [Streptomyces albospinus]